MSPLPNPTKRSSYVPCQLALLQGLSHPAMVTRLVSPEGVNIRYSQRRWHLHARAISRHFRGESAPLLEEVHRGRGYLITSASHYGTDQFTLRIVAGALQRKNMLALRLPTGEGFDLLVLHPLFPARILLMEVTAVSSQPRERQKAQLLMKTWLANSQVEGQPFLCRVTPRWLPCNTGAKLSENETVVHITWRGVEYRPVAWMQLMARLQGSYLPFIRWVTEQGRKDE